MSSTEEVVAAKMLQVFLQRDPTGEGISLWRLCQLLKMKYTMRFVKHVARQRPTEFVLYNKRVRNNSKLFVLSLIAAASSASAGTPYHNAGAAAANGTAAAGSGHYCKLCNLQLKDANSFQMHMRSSKHKVVQLLQQLRASGSIHANQGGLLVSELPELASLQVGEGRQVTLTVENVGAVTQPLSRVYQVRPLKEVSVLIDIPPGGWLLHPGTKLDIHIEVAPKTCGILCTLLILDFGFVIARELKAECDLYDPDLPDISASSPYVKPRVKIPVTPQTDFVPGEKPPKGKVVWQKPPRSHKVPNRLRELLSQQQSGGLQAELNRIQQDATGLTGHLKKLHTLLHLEELQQEIDVRTYDMSKVELGTTSGGRLLALQVPGLAEARPSVMRGDALYVSLHSDPTGREWQGYVHMVRQEEVLLRFNAAFHNTVHLPGRLFNVRFAIKRTSFVFMHEALDVAQRGTVAGTRSEILLPSADARGDLSRKALISSWLNRDLNPEQQSAVSCVVGGTSGQLPFIIWGPPGTGKTSTLVEAAAQVLRYHPTSRLLLVAPSNLAADLLAQRLIKAGRPKSELLRVCAFSRPREDLPAELDDVTLWDERVGAFRLPELQEVTANRIRVVVVTALMAGKLHALGVPAGHFTHVMMDEAGHAEEPLALCAIAGHIGSETAVVLAGDPKQLGPVIHSRLAREAGLGLSLLERLTAAAPYAAAVDPDAAGGSTAAAAHDGAAAGLIVKLVRNYRSHPELLKLPSRMFYGGELQACARSDITHSLLHWKRLPNPNFPLLFHSLVGKDEREANSPSWFNALEAKQVISYVTQIMTDPEMRRNRVTADQIGIITPYRRQVQKIKKLLVAKGYGAVQVGSVEQLQGQERRVVIISTVRSDPSYLDHDYKHKLGFVANPKRFNVAITRAQALMIVVGNPAVLMHDPHWRELLRTCQRSGSTVGQAMPDLSADEDGISCDIQQQVHELERMMASMVLHQAAEQVAAAAAAAAEISALVGEGGGAMVRHD